MTKSFREYAEGSVIEESTNLVPLEIRLEQDKIVVYDFRGRNGEERRVVPSILDATPELMKKVVKTLGKKYKIEKSTNGFKFNGNISDVDFILSKHR